MVQCDEIKVAKIIINLIQLSSIKCLWHVDADLDFEDKKVNATALVLKTNVFYWLEKSTRCKYHMSYAVLIVLIDLA